MAKFDSQYPAQLSPEDGDKFLIAAEQDGSIMSVTFAVLKSRIQQWLGIIDEQLSTTSEHAVQNKAIAQAFAAVHEWVIDQIGQAIVPEGTKEIITVSHYGDTAPENPEDNDLWINSETNVLWKYNEQDEEWEVDEYPSSDVIYVTADTSHIYVFRDGAFHDATGEQTDDTIYVNNLESLSEYQDDGLYKVCYTHGTRVNRTTEYFTMVVISHASTRKISYTLSNEDGYRTRTYNKLTHSWMGEDWNVNEYLMKSDIVECSEAEIYAMFDGDYVVDEEGYLIVPTVTIDEDGYISLPFTIDSEGYAVLN